MPESPGNAYRLFSILLLPFWFIHAWLHGSKYGVSDYLKIRFLFVKQSSTPSIWFHASSLGEVEAVSSLINQCLAANQNVLVTSFTASGFQAIQRNFGEKVTASILPVDCWPFCRLFLARHNLKLGLIMETELWPEMLFQAAQKFPLIQINARLSKKSTEAPIYIRYLLRRAIANFTLHLTREANDVGNLVDLGADKNRIKIIGNVKNQMPNDAEPTLANEMDRPYILLASSHEGEEYDFLKSRTVKTDPYLIVIAPRHPDRRERIIESLDNFNLSYAVRSRHEKPSSDTKVYLVDTLGELKQFLAHAYLVVMGGSFDNTGGHNLIEPANFSKAIITGPSDNNVKNDIKLLEDGRGILQVESMEQCWQEIDKLIDNPAEANKLGGHAAQKVIQSPDISTLYFNEIKQFF